MNRLVVKVGSNVLTQADGTLNIGRMSALVGQIAELRHLKWEVVLVSSGAVASGRSVVQPPCHLNSVEQRQLYSAVGQVKLLNHYDALFAQYGITIGQVLATKEDFSTRTQYLNLRSCLDVMLKCGIVPIVNENDTVSVTELMFTDNDELSGMIATMTEASRLIILSNVDGIFTGNPADEGAFLIREVRAGDDLNRYIRVEKSGFGRGGMMTKCGIARKVSAEGIPVLIANGNRENILTDLIHTPQTTPHTAFLPTTAKASCVKKWIAHSAGFSKGKVYLNDNAVKAIESPKAVSLLFVGVLKIEGTFERGDILTVCDSEGRNIAVGKTEYSSGKAAELIGQRNRKPLIHYNYLYME